MKCKYCGALIKKDELRCAYCGQDNPVAQKRQRRINELEEGNDALRQEVIRKNRFDVFLRILRRSTVALVALAVIFTVASFFVFYFKTNKTGASKDNQKKMQEYYAAGDLENLYYCMSDGNLFSPEDNYNCSYTALIWREYSDCIRYFATAHEDYLQKGYYDRYDLERSIEYGVKVLSGYISYIYQGSENAHNSKILKPYREEVRSLFANVYMVPDELLTECDSKAIFEYVEGVLSVEEE